MQGYQRREGLMLMLVRHMVFWELEPNQIDAAIRAYHKLQNKNIEE